ncbi:ABC transporter ATP-binding protein [Aerococcaceae bacterium DSM 111021]|nr:ABC transporter ATP-binding protein [Aerococcaceae bacterium DSM 111021]
MAEKDTQQQEEVKVQSQPKGVGPRGQGAVEKAHDFKGSLLRILKEVLNFKWAMMLVLFTTILSVLFNIIGPRELGNATSTLFDGVLAEVQGTGSIQYDVIGRILLTVLALYVVSSIFNWIQGFVMTGVTENVTYGLRKKMLDKIDDMPMKYFESHSHGEVLSRISNDIDTLGASLSQSFAQLINSVMTMIGIAIIMFTINWILALVVLIVVPISLLTIRILIMVSQKYFRQQQVSLGVINGQIEENFSGQNIVRAFNQEENAVATFHKDNAKLEESAWKSQFYSGVMFPFMRFLQNFGYAAVVMVGAYLVILGTIRVGVIQSFTQYVNRFTQPITQLAQIVTLFQTMVAAAERVFEFLDEEEQDQTTGSALDVSKVEGKVSFNHVQFGYDPEQIIITDFNADVLPGQKVALVGPTGAGKSTMVKLLMRFYDVDKGSINLDGVDIKSYSRANYQRSMSMVLQDTWLFNGSIMENIRYGRLDATDEEVIEAAKAVHVHNFVKNLPDGYNFEINEEASNISQGQKQLLTIARALLADRPVLILDEATSSVDTRTEILIQEAMDRVVQGRTSFVIAHRLSTIKNADLILYMENGDIMEQGSHDELIAREGKYANLYNSQFASGASPFEEF